MRIAETIIYIWTFNEKLIDGIDVACRGNSKSIVSFIIRDVIIVACCPEAHNNSKSDRQHWLGVVVAVAILGGVR
jgi:hypothetical protein